MRLFCFLLFCLSWTVLAKAQTLTIDGAFSSTKVWQRDQPIQITGFAPGADSVYLAKNSIFSQQGTSVQSDGIFTFQLSPKPAGGPYTFAFRSGEEVVLLENIYFGDVYLFVRNGHTVGVDYGPNDDLQRAALRAEFANRSQFIKTRFFLNRTDLDVDPVNYLGTQAYSGLIYEPSHHCASKPKSVSDFQAQLLKQIADVKTARPGLPIVLLEPTAMETSRFDANRCNYYAAELRAAMTSLGKEPGVKTVSTLDLYQSTTDQVLRAVANRCFLTITGGKMDAKTPYAVKLDKRGNDVSISFAGVGDGLSLKHHNSVQGLRYYDGMKWQQARGVLVSKDRVRLELPQGVTVKAIDYAWSNDAKDANLVNNFGLPVSSFRMSIAE